MRARFALFSVGYSVGLFLGMLICLEIGRLVGVQQTARIGEAARAGIGVVDGAVYALLALLLGFTFSGATARFDQRRELIVQEATSISTAWARLETLPSQPLAKIRPGFRRVVDALISFYAAPVGSAEATRRSTELVAAQNDVWSQCVAACLGEGGEPARMLVLPALNEMFAAIHRERLSRRIHPPVVIFVMLAVAAMATALFAGYSMANATTRNWFFMLGAAATIAVVTYVIIELEFPRAGLVRVDSFDKALVELRATMG